MEVRLIERGEESESLDLQKAQEVAQTLEQHYPNHPWLVSFQGRALIVRHILISDLVRNKMGRDGFGFVIKHLDSSSASDLAKKAVMAGGQMLEAFKLPRASWKGEEPVIPSEWSRSKIKKTGSLN